MKQALLNVVLLAAVGVSGPTILTAQQAAATGSRPNFSGAWVLDGGPEGGPWSPFGSRFTATQTAASLTLSIVTVLPAPHGGSGSPGAPHQRIITFNTEQRETYPPPGQTDLVPGGSWSYPVSSVSRSGWAGQHLVIASHTVSRVTAPDVKPPEYETRDLEYWAISLQGANRLVVERWRITDPVPWAIPTHDPPSASTTVYLRVSTRQPGDFRYQNKTMLSWKRISTGWVEAAQLHSNVGPITFTETGRTEIDGNLGTIVRAHDRELDVFVPDLGSSGHNAQWLRQRHGGTKWQWQLLGPIADMK